MASFGDTMVSGTEKDREHRRFVSVQTCGCLSVARRSNKQRKQQRHLAGYLAMRECEVMGMRGTRLGGDVSDIARLTRGGPRMLCRCWAEPATSTPAKRMHSYGSCVSTPSRNCGNCGDSQLTTGRRQRCDDFGARQATQVEWGETKRTLGSTGRNVKRELMPGWATVAKLPLYKLKRQLAGWKRVRSATVLRVANVRYTGLW